MNIAIVIIHNKTDSENFDQIETVKKLVTKHEDLIKDPESGNEWVDRYYTFKNLLIPHRVAFYQIFAFGVKLPSNKDDLDSWKVFYGKGDEDKTGDHLRFFNWGLKRSTDQGADLTIMVEDAKTFLFDDLLPCINNTKDSCVLDYYRWGKIAHKELQLLFDPKTPVIDETKTKTNAFNELALVIQDIGLAVTNG